MKVPVAVRDAALNLLEALEEHNLADNAVIFGLGTKEAHRRNEVIKSAERGRGWDFAAPWVGLSV